MRNGEAEPATVAGRDCEWCSKTFASRAYTLRHIKICSERRRVCEVSELTKELAIVNVKNTELEAKLAELNEKIAELTSTMSFSSGRILELKDVKPQTINNTYINPKLAAIPTANIRPLTIDTVREDVHKYGYAEFLRGIPGVAKFIEDIISKTADNAVVERNYVCTDASRNSFHRLIESKDWSSDGAAQFIHSILDELRDVSNKHFTTLVAEERAAISDELQREHIDAQKALVKPAFFGITGSSFGSDREKLFKSLRSQIKGIATV